MATSSNGAGTVASNGGTAAQRTQEKHASHHVTRSDASGEALARAFPSDQQITPGVAGENPEETGSPKAKDLKIKQNTILDTNSKEAFPALGAGPKPQVLNHVATAWDSKNGASVSNGPMNGVNGVGPMSNASSSRASSPAVSTTPVSTNGPGTSQVFGSPVTRLTIPGQYTHKIQFTIAQLHIKKSFQEIVRDINNKSRAVVRFWVNTGVVSFEATGPGDSPQQALRDVANQVGVAQPKKVSSQGSVRANAVSRQEKLIQQIQKQTGAKISIQRAGESTLPNPGNASNTIDIVIEGNAVGADSPDKINFRLRGTSKQVEDAKKQLEQRAKVVANSVTESIKVDKNYHSNLIGAGGANIRNIIKAAGGSQDPNDDTYCGVQFPHHGSNESIIQVEGNEAVVEKVVAAIESFVQQKNRQRTQVIEVAPEKHNLLIGREGANRRKLESNFNVRIDIPKKSQEGAARSQIKITGLPEDIEKACKDIMITIDKESKTIKVPRRIHHAMSDYENIFTRLRRNYDVTVSHPGEKLPPEPLKVKYAPNRGQKTLPLIIGEQNAAENYTWEVSDPSSAEQEEGVIAWVLRGPSAGVDKAVAVVEKAIQETLTRQQSSKGYLVLPDPGSHRFIVGQRGSQINAIREQTGCRITIPREQAEGEAIEIVGSREEVENAKDIILEIVQANGKRGQRARRD